jgi:catechol 2,3-dioxygenase-like lactoylglutathione lyase family enzyme
VRLRPIQPDKCSTIQWWQRGETNQRDENMLDHIGFRVRDLEAARQFYDAAMAVLGLQVIVNTETSFLIGRSAEEPIPFIWVGTDEPAFWTAANPVSASPIHVAFSAKDREAVDAFYRAALGAGGLDNGAPGPRGPREMNYYAAFVIDPDGNNIEAGFRGC